MRPRATHLSQSEIGRASGKRGRVRSAFSLVELLVVLGIAMLLTGLLMPALRQVHENANRVMCMSNLQQMASAFVMYDADNKNTIPYSLVLHTGKSPRELMQSRTRGIPNGWDGLGLLYQAHYCNTPECFYCPSHHGEHLYERYANSWNAQVRSGEQIYTNYHYSGDVGWGREDRSKRRKLDEGHRLVLMTDGLRTLRDFNHVSGMNVLRGDGSVRWREDTSKITETVSASDSDPGGSKFAEVWDVIESSN